MDNFWIDCFGKEGSVKRNQYHGQEYYYPIWMPESYTVRGTLIPGTMSNEGHAPYPWGYVDNVGSDCVWEYLGLAVDRRTVLKYQMLCILTELR